MNTKANDLDKQLEQILNTYKTEVIRETDAAAKESAKKAAQQLRATSPKRVKGGRKGQYARGWGYRKIGSGYVTYNRTDPQLTHLLEYGHDHFSYGVATGEKAKPKQHIKNAEQVYTREYEARIRRALG